MTRRLDDGLAPHSPLILADWTTSIAWQAEILKAFRAFYRCMEPGGGCRITVRDDGDVEPTVHAFRSWYYAVSPIRMEALLREAGFSDLHRAECDYYQPVTGAREGYSAVQRTG